MKKALLLFVFMVFALTANFHSLAQWIPNSNWLTFDNGDTISQRVISIDTVNCHHNIWQIGRPQKTIFTSAWSAPNAIITDTLNPYPNNDTSVFTLTFPSTADFWPIYLFEFYYQLNIDTSVIVQIDLSIDSGKSWINLQDSTPARITVVSPLSKDPGWHNWEMIFNYPFYYSNNDSLQMRFTFISGNDTSGKDGWIIDNFYVYYPTERVATIRKDNFFIISPNPAFNDLTISATGELIHSVVITDMLGQTVYRQEGNTEQMQVDVSHLSNGIYFARINNTTVRKFVKD